MVTHVSLLQMIWPTSMNFEAISLVFTGHTFLFHLLCSFTNVSPCDSPLACTTLEHLPAVCRAQCHSILKRLMHHKLY